jgi:hypothetical protein
LDLLAEGIKSQGGHALNFHLTTTPQLQFYGNKKIIQFILPMLLLKNRSKMPNKYVLSSGKFSAVTSPNPLTSWDGNSKFTEQLIAQTE